MLLLFLVQSNRNIDTDAHCDLYNKYKYLIFSLAFTLSSSYFPQDPKFPYGEKPLLPLPPAAPPVRCPPYSATVICKQVKLPNRWDVSSSQFRPSKEELIRELCQLQSSYACVQLGIALFEIVGTCCYIMNILV